MRILHCIWRLSLGGAERQLVQLAAGLRAHGADVHVATVYPGWCDEPLAATGATPHRLFPLGKYDVTLVPRMALLLRRLEPDVVTTWLTQMDIVSGLASRIARVPWVVCERSAAGSYPPGVLHRVRARVGGRADAIVANSEVGREYWLPYAEESRIKVIPNIVPLDEIERVTATADKLDADDDVVLYVGRFSAEKNLDRLIEALARVLPRRPRAKAVFCGDGILRPAIEQKAAALGIGDRALFLGPVSNVFAWMKRAAVAVGVSTFEGNPNTALEAIACGTPLVVSDIAPYRALVGDQSAFLVDPLSIDSIAAGIDAALADRAEARGRAERARGVVAGRSAEQIAARYIEVFDNVTRRTA